MAKNLNPGFLEVVGGEEAVQAKVYPQALQDHLYRVQELTQLL